MPQIPGQTYLIQYRSFLPSAISKFELAVRNGSRPDTRASFAGFASRTFGSYRGFLSKWVTSDFARDQMVLEYDDFLADPLAGLERAVRVFDPDRPIDAAAAAAAIASIDGEKIEKGKVQRLDRAGVHSARNVRAFRHFEPQLFRQIERMRLTREEVTEVFLSLLNREPAEANMLGLPELQGR